jgi:hypothetical protein
MKSITKLIGICFTSVGIVHAAPIKLINATPQAGQMIVQYQFLNKDKQPEGIIATTVLPSHISIPHNASGIRVLTLQNHSLPNREEMPGGWFNFPDPGCNWTNDSGRDPRINFFVSKHSISCK